jgi:hypothetical protein
MKTVQFTHRITRTSDQLPFHQGLDEQSISDYAYAENLLSTGWNGLLTINIVREETLYQNSFTCDEDTFTQWRQITQDDPVLNRAQLFSYQYGLDAQFDEVMDIKYLDENGQVISDDTIDPATGSQN